MGVNIHVLGIRPSYEFQVAHRIGVVYKCVPTVILVVNSMFRGKKDKLAYIRSCFEVVSWNAAGFVCG